MNWSFYGADIFDVFYVRMVTDRFKCIQNSLNLSQFTVQYMHNTSDSGPTLVTRDCPALKTATEMFQNQSQNQLCIVVRSQFIHFNIVFVVFM